MHGALHGTPCVLESGRDIHSVLGKPRLAGHALLRCRARALSSRRTIARPTRETSPSPFDRCAPTACLDVSRAVESSTARPRPPLFSYPVKGKRRARSGTSSIERFHRSGASSPKTLSMPTRPSRGLATTRQRAGFLTWPLEDLHRLAPIQIGSSWFLHPTPRSAVVRPAHPFGSTDAVGGPELATWPPRSWARRRFASGVSAPSTIRSMQRSGFPRRCTFRLRRRRSTSTDTPNVGTDSAESSILAHPCRAGARQSRHPPCDEKRNAGALAGHRVLVLHRCRCGANGACATPVPRECEPRSVTTALRRPLVCAGRRHREEEFDATSNRAPSRTPPSTLRHRRRSPRGMEIATWSCAPPVETHRRMRTPRRAALPTNRGAIRHRSLVRGPDDAFAPFGSVRIAPHGALLERAEALRIR